MLTRKLGEIGSVIFRNIFFPFVRIIIELKTNSIMKQKSYIYKGTVLHGKNYIGRDTKLANVDVGFGTIIHKNGDISNCKVGKYCSIGPGVSTIGGTHPTKGFKSTHPAFYAKNNVSGFSYMDSVNAYLKSENDTIFEEYIYIDKSKGYLHEIGNDVWIGANVLIFQGVKIGDGVIVGSNAIVNKNLDPYGIYVGAPAKKIGQRFSDEEIDSLLSEKWWDKGEEWIKLHIGEFINIGENLNEH